MGGRVADVTLRLIRVALGGFGGRNVAAALTRLVELAAQRQDRHVAYVTVAAPLGPAEEQRLGAALAARYGREVSLKTTVDPRVLGGVRVRVGADLYDGTIARRLAQGPDRLGFWLDMEKGKKMAELTISKEEIRSALERYISSYQPDVTREEVGTVALAGDGIARVEGLPSTMAQELLEFEDGTLGVALNLEVREIGVVVLGEFAGIEEGQQVKRTGRVLSVPVGDAFLGRVVDALGNPIDGLGEIAHEGLPGAGAAGAQRDAASAGGRAAADRDQGDRRHDPDRPGAAAADHRRPQDR